MLRRAITVLLGLPVILAAAWFGSPWLTILLAAAALTGWWEFHAMFSHGRGRYAFAFGALWTLLLVVSGQYASRWGDGDLPLLTYAVLGSGAAIALGWLLTDWAYGGFLERGRLVLGPVYVGFLLAHAVALRGLEYGSNAGRDWFLFALLTTFATDVGALLVGRSIGRHRMAPSISPAKTWEGALGGFLCAVAIGSALGAILDLPLQEAVWLAVAVGTVAQAGDLTESRMKRAAGVKDASGIIPGHGGVLDRLDSVVFTMPVVYYLVTLVVEQ